MRSVAKTLRASASGTSTRDLTTQLPPRLPQLVGREDKINNILGKLASPPFGKRLLIHGPPGVGKTAIALETAHRACEALEYDVIVWLDCQQFRLGKDDVVRSVTALRGRSDIVRELALAVNAEAALREPERERMQNLRFRLSEHRCLIIADAFDEIADDATETYVVELPHSVDVVATSRRNLWWRGAEYTEPLSEADAEKLIRSELATRRFEVGEKIIERLVEICDGIPQTIGWLTALVSRGRTLAELEEELKRPGANISRYYFSSQWKEVVKDLNLMRALALVAVAPSIRKQDAAVALNVPDSAIKALNRLEERNLISYAGDYVTMIPTIRRLVLKAVEEVEGVLVSVKADWMDNLTTRVIAAQSRKTWRDVFHQIESFRLELLAALRMAASPDSPDQQLRGARLLDASVYYLYSRGLWDGLLEAAEWAVPFQARRGNTDSVMEVGLTWAIRAYRYRDGIERAEQFLKDTSMVLSQSRGNVRVAFHAHLRMARSTLRHEDHVDLELAEDLAMDAEQFYLRGDYEWACRAMLQAGNVWSESGKLDDARRAFLWVYNLVSKLAPVPWSVEMSSLALGNSGIVANRSGEFEDASRLLEDSVTGLGQAYDQATAHGELARAYFNQRKFKQAKRHASTCLELSRQLGLKTSVMESEVGWELDVGKKLLGKSVLSLWLDNMLGLRM